MEASSLPDLLARIVAILLERTDAERILVLCPTEGAWFIEAVREPGAPAGRTGMHLPAFGAGLLPVNVLEHVLRTGQAVLAAGAAADTRFAGDAYLRAHRVTSLLCYPIRHGDTPRLVLYLENSRTAGAFDGSHLELLRLLSGQMVSSLGNAAKYEEMKASMAVQGEEKERLRVALEGTSDGIWDWDYRTGQAHFSDRYYTMLGYEPGEFPASYESWRRRLHPDDLEATENAVQEAVGRNVPFAVEFRIRAKDGEWRWVLGRGKVAALDGEGKPVRVAGSHTDITERKRTEEALEKRILALTRPLDAAEAIAFEDMLSLADLQLLQDGFAAACGVAALITRPNGTPITRPSGFCSLCADIVRKTEKGLENCIRSDSTIGRYNPSGPNIQPCLSAGLCNAGASITVGGRHVANWLIGQVRNERHVEEEVAAYARKIGADEDAFRVAYRKVPMMPQRQFENVAHFLFTVANQISNAAYQNIQQARFIAERRKAEEEVRSLNRELERRVAGRTAELEATNRELEAFSYSVSHDLRAPLRAMHGFSNILLEDFAPLLGEEGKRACSVVHSEANRMSGLIDDLLKLSRLGRSPMAISPLDMAGMAKAVYEEGTSPSERQRICFQVDAMPPAVGDPALIRQIWANLLSNAVKYSGRQEEARIRAGGDAGTGESIYWVEDNGAGFDMKYAAKLFGVFQRLHGPKEFEGNGVGLAIVKRIIHRHGGKVWARGEVGVGATFYFSLPASGRGEESAVG